MDQWYGNGLARRARSSAPTLHAAATPGREGAARPARARRRSGGFRRSSGRPPRRWRSLYVAPADLPAGAASCSVDFDPDVRIAALGMIEAFDARVRAQAAAPLLADPVRGVRVEAARVLADVPDDRLTAGQRAQPRKALNEYLESLRLDADWPAANVNLGNLRMRQRRIARRASRRTSARFRSTRASPGAYVNLADAYRQPRARRARARSCCGAASRSCRARPSCTMRWGCCWCARATRPRRSPSSARPQSSPPTMPATVTSTRSRFTPSGSARRAGRVAHARPTAPVRPRDPGCADFDEPRSRRRQGRASLRQEGGRGPARRSRCEAATGGAGRRPMSAASRPA